MKRLSTEEVKRIFGNSEDQEIEWVESLKNRIDDGLEDLCSFLNTDKGKGSVYFGINKKGDICGIEECNHDEVQRKIKEKADLKYDPKIILNIETVEIIDKERCYLIHVFSKRNKMVPYHEYDSVAWLREGSAKRKLSVQEKDNLRRIRDRGSHTGPWKCNRCGSITGMLASIKIFNGIPQKSYNCSCGGEFWPL